MSASIYQYETYRRYLYDTFAAKAPGTPTRAALCQKLGCQSSFISQVFNNKAHLSLEHAVSTAIFLGLNPDERRYFMLLVQADRAGTPELSEYFGQELKNIRAQLELIRSTIGVNDKLTEEAQAIYYSQWWYAAIHILVALPEVNSLEDLKKRLRLPLPLLRESVNFLLENQLVENRNRKLEIGKRRVHIGSHGKNVTRHHMNWRAKTLDTLAIPHPDELHFTGIIGISRKGAAEIRSKILQLLRETEGVVEKTTEESAYVLLFDFFELNAAG